LTNAARRLSIAPKQGPVRDWGEGTKLFAFKVDAEPPTVNISRPADGADYQLGKVVTASYKCVDKQSGIASCNVTVANGANLDTSTVGADGDQGLSIGTFSSTQVPCPSGWTPQSIKAAGGGTNA
jgi:hypothetical protein